MDHSVQRPLLCVGEALGSVLPNEVGRPPAAPVSPDEALHTAGRPQGLLGPQSCGWRAACPATFLGTSPTRLPLLPAGPYSSPRPLLTPRATPDAAQGAFIQGKEAGVLMALN